jgi:hypothetical protein
MSIVKLNLNSDRFVTDEFPGEAKGTGTNPEETIIKDELGLGTPSLVAALLLTYPGIRTCIPFKNMWINLIINEVKAVIVPC